MGSLFSASGNEKFTTEHSLLEQIFTMLNVLQALENLQRNEAGGSECSRSSFAGLLPLRANYVLAFCRLYGEIFCYAIDVVQRR